MATARRGGRWCRCIAAVLLSCALSPSRALSMNMPGQVSTKIVVTGAAGRTGSLVFSKLIADPRFDAVGLVRSETSAKKLISKTKCELNEVVVCDVTNMEFGGEDDHPWPRILDGAEAMVICTSAVPQISKSSVIKAMLKAPINVLSGEKAINFRDFKFKFKPGQYPERVDYVGQTKQIDFAKKLGIKHVVLISSMGVLDPDNFLNSIGKDKNGDGHGDILVWKRRAEKYLCLSGLRYSIIHPGGLMDTDESKMKLVLDVDDNLMRREKKSIARGDVAELAIASLTADDGRSVSFDCVGEEAEEGAAVPSADDTLREFLLSGRTADYTLGPSLPSLP